MSNLLSTNTVNFQDLIGNGRSYKVPAYQRDYSWTDEQWEDLWLDIAELRPDSDKRHYMGAVVVKAESDRQFLIIDGQQRIATLTILGLSVINRLQHIAANGGPPENKERAEALRSRYIGEKDPASLTEISKLALNKHDDGFFQDYLVQLRRPINPRSLPKSNKLLWECFAYFEKQIAGDPGLADDGLRLAELLSEVVARRLLFISIIVDDEMSAYTVFETLNARGLELTTTDLLKNYLFSRLHSTNDLEAVQRRWERLIATVRQERFGTFLRYHYLTKQRQIRSGRLFKIVRDEVNSPAEVIALITILEERAEVYDALGDPGHSLWAETPEAIPYIRELALFKVSQMTPLLFAAFEKLSREDFVRVLKLTSIVSFRYTVISGLNPNELEPVYHEAAKAVLNNTAVTDAQVFNVLKSVYVRDENFLADFSQKSIATSGQRKKVTKYILCKLEQDASGKTCDFETDPGTIEHILPENPSDEWDSFISRERWDNAIYRLGNLTLLPAPVNRDLGGKSFREKLSAYENSSYILTRTIAEIAPEEWTLEVLEARQKNLAQRAVHIWRADFAN